MSLPRLRDFTSARVALGRTGDSLPTSEFLALQLAHARARGAVHSKLDTKALLRESSRECVVVRSQAADRAAYLQRPDLGRKLSLESRESVQKKNDRYDVVFVIADGLSADAVQIHAAGLIESVLPDLAGWSVAPFVVVEQGRVAIGDEIGECIGASMSVVLIGERPGLSSADSMGVYLTWDPHPRRSDAERNCISNIRTGGLSYAAAASKLAFLMKGSHTRKLSGVRLKDDFPLQLA